MKSQIVFRGAVLVASLVFAVQGWASPMKKTIHIGHPLQVAGTMLEPGDYAVTVDGNEATFEKGHKVIVKATVTVKDTGVKSSQNAVIYDDKGVVSEVRFSGETQVATFAPTTSASTPAHTNSTDR
jgi:hypothetical protein